jgi:hypothetical protein
VIIAVLCIPVMLFGKPFHILMHQRRAKRAVSDNMVVIANLPVMNLKKEILNPRASESTCKRRKPKSSGMEEMV